MAMPSEASRQGRVPTRYLFLLAVVASVALTWATNEFVMTRTVIHNLLGSQLDASQIDQNFDVTRGYTVWGYLLLPLVLWARIALVALFVQMVGLLATAELPFRGAFRAATWAFFGLLYGNVVRVVWLLRLGEGNIDAAALNVTPGSLAHFLMPAQESPSLVYNLASLLNPWELIWALILFFALRATGRIRTAGAAGLVAVVWTLLALFQIGVVAFMAGLSV
jgi:hypothetical protein